MNPAVRFRKLVFVQVVLGIIAFCIASSSMGMLLVAGVLAMVSWYFTEGPSEKYLPRWAINIAALAGMAWLILELRLHRGHVVIVMGHFTMWLQILLLYAHKRNREYAQLLVLSLMLMTGASVLSVSIIYGMMLVVYCVVAVWSLLLFQFKITSDRVRLAHDASFAGAPGSAQPMSTPGREFLWQFRFSAVAITLLCAVVGLIVFVVAPRSPEAGMHESFEGPIGNKRVGFSQKVQLSTSPSAEGSQEPVLNLAIRFHGEEINAPSTWLLRGASLDEYDARQGVWRRGRLAETETHPFELSGGQLSLAYLSPRQPTYEATVTLRRTGYRTLFTIGPVVELESSSFSRVMFSKLDQQLSVGEGISGAVNYTVRWPLRAPEDLDARYSRALDPRIESPGNPRRHWRSEDLIDNYARGWRVEAARVRGYTLDVLRQHGLTRSADALYTPNDRRIAAALAEHLRETFRYQLTNPPAGPSVDPVVHFMFTTQAGHCELFASAHAAMARSIGMRARVITGYRVSDYNTIGNYYVVRHGHAHAWTEIDCGPGIGWREFDATPPALVEAEHAASADWTRGVRHLLEHLEFLWIKSIVAYDQKSRLALLASIRSKVGQQVESGSELWRDWSRSVERWIGRGPSGTTPGKMAWLTLVVLLVVVLIVALGLRYGVAWVRKWRLKIKDSPARPTAAPSLPRDLMFYRELLGILARAGHRKPRHESPLQFATRLEQREPDRYGDLPELITMFYSSRYGPAELDATQKREIGRRLDQVRRSATAHESPRPNDDPRRD